MWEEKSFNFESAKDKVVTVEGSIKLSGIEKLQNDNEVPKYFSSEVSFEKKKKKEELTKWNNIFFIIFWKIRKYP